MTDLDGNPIPGQRFRVEFPDGTTKEGTVDRSGRIRVFGPTEGDCKVSFPASGGEEGRDAQGR